MISNSKAFRRRKTRFQILGSVAGVGGIMGVAYLICDGVYQAISNALGGALDDVLDKFGESNLGGSNRNRISCNRKCLYPQNY